MDLDIDIASLEAVIASIDADIEELDRDGADLPTRYVSALQLLELRELLRRRRDEELATRVGEAADEVDPSQDEEVQGGENLDLRDKLQPHNDHSQDPATAPTQEANIEQVTEGLRDVSIGPTPNATPEAGQIEPCISCSENINLNSNSYLQGRCGHYYCRDCIRRLVEDACHDEELFPLRCCRQEFDMEPNDRRVVNVLGYNLYRLYRKKAVEFSTVDRTYCSNKICSTFIPPSDIDESRAHCLDCGTVTCSSCKKISHEGECGADPDIEATKALASQQGWKSCQCGRIIELAHGCNHMT